MIENHVKCLRQTSFRTKEVKLSGHTSTDTNHTHTHTHTHTSNRLLYTATDMVGENTIVGILTLLHENPVAVHLLICLGEVTSIGPQCCSSFRYNRIPYTIRCIGIIYCLILTVSQKNKTLTLAYNFPEC